MNTARTLPILLFLLLTSSTTFAEGVASMTNVTAANCKNLPHHGLAVICKSQRGKTFVDLVVRSNPKHPFGNCSVTIHDKDGRKVLVQVDPVIRKASRLAGLPEGRRVYFHVADELVDRTEIRYHLHANEFQSHVFTIKMGELRKLAALPR